MLKTRAWILLFALCLIDGCLIQAVAGIKPLWLGFVMAPIAVISLGLGLDISRKILAPLLRGKRNSPYDSTGTIIMLVCLLVMPLPLTLVLAYANYVLPHQMLAVTDLFTAWRVAAGLTIVSAFLRLADYPISLRAVEQLFIDAYIRKEP